jgi:ABC-type Fe2+-enterobactin transport system substrate-binding protein
MAHLQFKWLIKNAWRKENINTYFSKKDITIEWIEEYSGNIILISAINGDSDTVFTDWEIVVVDYQTTVKNYNDKSYWTNQYLSHTGTNTWLFAEEEEDSKSFERWADGRLLDTKSSWNLVDDLLSELKE